MTRAPGIEAALASDKGAHHELRVEAEEQSISYPVRGAALKGTGAALRLAATDLSNHVSCAHLTSLSLADAAGQLPGGFTNFDPLLKLLRERGQAHENAYLAYLRASGLRVESGGTETLAWMAAGVDVITQASLGAGIWHGRADFLVRVERSSPAWAWSYEVIDTKLSSDTRAGTVLQLCVYSNLLALAQGVAPAEMHVVKPGPDFPRESFRYDEYAAIYRALRGDLEQRVAAGPAVTTYPEPAAHCDTCNWRTRCDDQRRADDHLSFVADLGRSHQRELANHAITTLSALAAAPSPWPHRPERGSASTYTRLAQQARLQFTARGAAIPPFELLPVEPERGLARLPEPSPGDVFLDFEGDPFIGASGREYLFGWTTADGGYQCLWATDDATEKAALEAFLDVVEARWAADPGMHVYHFAPYEPTALKRLVGRYGTRGEELDRLLRGGRLVDLYALTRQTARIGVESYSIKNLEPLIGYTRPVALATTGPLVYAVKVALQRGFPDALEPAWTQAVEAYNRGDCESASALRDWLEARRTELRAAGAELPRPPVRTGEREVVTEVRSTAAVVAARLLDGLSDNRDERTVEQQGRWLLGHLMEWYRREASVTWWEYFRLAGTSDEERLEEPSALAGLVHEERIVGKKGTNPIDRYSFPPQDVFIRAGSAAQGGADDESKVGVIEAIDLLAHTVLIKRTKKTLDVHPTSIFAHTVIAPKPKDAQLVQIGASVADFGLPSADRPSLVRDLLCRALPRGVATAGVPLRHAGEPVLACALRLAPLLDDTILPIQGPPGTGKTYTAAQMILALVRAGRRVGVTATSHAVVENLVARTASLANAEKMTLRAARKCDGADDMRAAGVEYIHDPKAAAERMMLGHLDLLGATCWQWARDDMRASVDVLFIDEAGQLSLADALAVTGAARSLVLVGDPQQLEQPIHGTHPDGVAVSVLQHMLGDAQTVQQDRGLFLDETHRLHPTIAAFTSEQFYEGRLATAASVAQQELVAPPLSGPGLFWHPVVHDGNQNRSLEEAAAVAELVRAVLGSGHTWTNERGQSARLTESDVLVVAPYNAHLAAIRDALTMLGLGRVSVGTVDKFQGREAAVAIYSMATSHPDDAPRGLGFLYDRHRLNVATSRARCASVLVASPALLRPVCATPRHLHLASALARFVETATRSPQSHLHLLA